jgi:hypothetical protein
VVTCKVLAAAVSPMAHSFANLAAVTLGWCEDMFRDETFKNLFIL